MVFIVVIITIIITIIIKISINIVITILITIFITIIIENANIFLVGPPLLLEFLCYSELVKKIR